MTRPESLRAQMQLGDCDHLRALAETLTWQQRALLELSTQQQRDDRRK